MRIHFVRHGESEANVLHVISNRGRVHGLTPRGREQAEALARRLQGYLIVGIFSSPLLRALETSAILAERLEVPYEVTDALREYDCGAIEGRADEEAWAEWQALFDAWALHRRYDERLAGGESFHDVRQRFVPFIAGLLQRYRASADEVVCVAHGGLYRMMLPLVLANVDAAQIARRGLDHTVHIVAEQRKDGLVCVSWSGEPVA